MEQYSGHQGNFPDTEREPLENLDGVAVGFWPEGGVSGIPNVDDQEEKNAES